MATANTAFRPYDVTIGGTAVKSVKAITRHAARGEVTSHITDGEDNPSGVSQGRKVSALTGTITFYNEKERQKVLALTGTATLVYKTKNKKGGTAQTHTILNCCDWKEGTGFTGGASPSDISVSFSYFSADGTTDPYSIT